MKRILALVEGQTEERFVKDILRPRLESAEVAIIPTIVTTKRVKSGGHFKGGISKFEKVDDDLRRLLGDTGAAMVTTIFDYYRFPKDFDGWSRLTAQTPHQRVEQLEHEMERRYDDRRFRAYLMLHEYEALLLADPGQIAAAMNEHHEPQKADQLRQEVDKCSGPEKVDEGDDTHPSRRIENLFPRYKKVLFGPIIAKRIGLDRLREACPHFGKWLSDLEAVRSRRP